MRSHRVLVLTRGLLVSAICLIGAAASADEGSLQRWTSGRLPLDQMPANVREQVRKVMDHPTVYSKGPVETFHCNPQVYHWYLDHPDRAVAAWRKLGATVLPIEERGKGRFGWSDGNGSDVHWDTVYRDDALRVWFADGQVKSGMLAPSVPFQAVVVMQHVTGQDEKGQSVIRHQADLILHTDSRGARLLTRMLGAKVPELGQQYVAQLEMFFSALPWYIHKHPDRAQELLNAAPAPSTATQEVPAKQQERPGLLRSLRERLSGDRTSSPSDSIP